MLPTIATGNVGSALAGEYEVANSLRFNDDSSDYLDKSSYATATSTKKFTWSCWFKLGEVGARGRFFDFWKGGGSGFSYGNGLFFTTGHELGIGSGDNSNGRIITTRKFRDPSAWYHVVAVYDSPNSTAGDRLQLYVNGVRETDFSANVTVTQDWDYQAFTSNHGGIGTYYDKSTSSEFFDGYMAEVVFIDGLALDPTSFGEFDEDTNIWKPIDVSGLTFGNNGFYLDFENSSSLGADVSGNGNNFTVNNLTSIDQTTDTPTNNFATWSPLRYTGNLISFSEGNLKATALTDGSAFFHSAYSSIGVTQGKWYAEFKCAVGGNPTNNIMIAGGSYEYDQNGNNQNGIVSGITHYNGLGEIYVDTVGSSGLTTYASGDIIGVALNVDDGQITFYKNGSQISTTRTLTTTASNGITYFIGIVRDLTVKSSWEANFGNPPFTISSGNSDGNGYGNFEYSVPSGYYALNTKNLAEYG